MATRATISILLADDSATTIYSHWDGYPEGVGATLLESYNTEAQVQELIANGDVSSLDHTIEDSEFYHRDRGEVLSTVCAQNYELDEIDSMQEYNYLWADDEWLVAVNGVWYKLAYHLEAQVGEVYSYLDHKETVAEEEMA